MGGFVVKDLRARRIPDALEHGAALAAFGRQESAEAERIGGQAAGHQGLEKCRRAGNGDHRNAMADGERDQAETRIADAGRTGIGDERDRLPLPRVA